MILNSLEKIQIHYYLNIMNFKKTWQKWDHTLGNTWHFLHKYVLCLCTSFIREKSNMCAHTHRPHKCTWSLKRVCVAIFPVKLLESFFFCITSSMAWHFPTVNKLGDGENSRTYSKASRLEKDGGGRVSNSWSKRRFFILPWTNFLVQH